jgi:DNA-binding MarR family transcriptional regulator
MESADLPARELMPYLVGRASRSMDRAWLSYLRRHGVTLTQWQVLAILARHDGARLGELAKLAGSEQSLTSRVVDQMERDGLVRRVPAPGDRRVVRVRLSPRGHELFATLRPAARDLVVRATAGVDEAGVRAMAEALAVVITNLDGPSPERARPVPAVTRKR